MERTDPAASPVQLRMARRKLEALENPHQIGDLIDSELRCPEMIGRELLRTSCSSARNDVFSWATRNGVSHFEPVGDCGDFRGITTAWFLYQLRGDATAGQLFKGTCRSANHICSSA